MDRRKTLATVGAISLTASAAVVALGSSMGLFGLADTGAKVGKLSPIDVSRPARTTTKTIIVTDPAPAPVATTAPDSGSNEDHHSGSGRADDHNVSAGSGGTGTSTPTAGAASPAVTDNQGAATGTAPAGDDAGHESATTTHDHDDD